MRELKVKKGEKGFCKKIERVRKKKPLVRIAQRAGTGSVEGFLQRGRESQKKKQNTGGSREISWWVRYSVGLSHSRRRKKK